ncbi:hypothetical protein ACWIYZ_04945 [Ursidibacter arcticus]
MAVTPMYSDLPAKVGCFPKGDNKLAKQVKALEERIKTVEGKEDKDTLFDPTELEKKVTDLTSKITELTEQVNALTEFKDKVTAGLAEVQNFNGEVSFKAFTKDTQL